MPRKKSIRRSAQDFRNSADAITAFLAAVAKGQSAEHISWLHDYAVICLYREFELLVLDTLVGAINNDTSTVTKTTGIEFPTHLSADVCQFLITGTGYFDFKGRTGLISTLRKFVPESHYLVPAFKKPTYRNSLDRLCALRNYAAHESTPSKKRALEAVGAKRIASSGAWLKCEGRFQAIVDDPKALVTELESAAPF